jgi:hypothetical protein
MDAASGFEIHFELDAVENIEPWKDGEDRFLTWFGLSRGRYWISTPHGDALRYADEFLTRKGSDCPYVEYQVARLFEDLEVQMSTALEAVPPDVAVLVSNPQWFGRAEQWYRAQQPGVSTHVLWEAATGWWQDRAFNLNYLAGGPCFHLWRNGDEVFVRWETIADHQQRWAIPNGQFSVSVTEFESTCYAFFEQAVDAMENRIDRLVANGWSRPDCVVDIPGLIAEHLQRKAVLRNLRQEKSETDWDNVRIALACLDAEIHGCRERSDGRADQAQTL